MAGRPAMLLVTTATLISLHALGAGLLGCGAGPLAAGSETSKGEGGETSEGETGSTPCADPQLPELGAATVLVDDLDGDGHLDLVGLRRYSHELEIAWGDGLGGFEYELGPVFSPTPGLSRLLAGDVDGDGRRDLVLYQNVHSHPSAVVRRQTGPRVFGPAQVSEFFGDWTTWESLPALLRDIDHDGAVDLVVGDSIHVPEVANLATAIADGLGGFGPLEPAPLSLWCFTIDIAAGDFDGSGTDELVLVGPWTCNGSHDPTELYIVDLDASGQATIRAELEVGDDPMQAVVADFDGDGALDFVVRNGADLSPFRGRGDGSFEPRPRVSAEPRVGEYIFPSRLFVAELDGDAAAELLLVTWENAVAVRTTWRIDDPLGAAILEPIADHAISAVGDFDEDGCDDLLYLERNGEPSVRWFLRRCAGGCRWAWGWEGEVRPAAERRRRWAWGWDGEVRPAAEGK